MGKDHAAILLFAIPESIPIFLDGGFQWGNREQALEAITLYFDGG